MKTTYSLIAVALAAVIALPVSSRAQETEVAGEPQHYNGALGFHSVTAPLGGRWWFGGQRVGLDAGLGFRSSPAPSYDERLSDWALDVGVPIVVKHWDRVHLLFRPGFLYESDEQQTSTPPDPFGTDDETTLSITAELEAEVFIVNNFSVSASHGIGFSSVSPAGGGDSETTFGTLGNNFTNIGFHIYFFGGSQN
ncbi:MAG TPA: hypothetical protein VFX92_05560 [Candidatus Krumholzibacteria bacterium]|nr:hypothetical protein [Candidatus Krumholzibacteria bacterium]